MDGLLTEVVDMLERRRYASLEADKEKYPHEVFEVARCLGLLRSALLHLEQSTREHAMRHTEAAE